VLSEIENLYADDPDYEDVAACFIFLKRTSINHLTTLNRRVAFVRYFPA